MGNLFIKEETIKGRMLEKKFFVDFVFSSIASNLLNFKNIV